MPTGSELDGPDARSGEKWHSLATLDFLWRGVASRRTWRPRAFSFPSAAGGDYATEMPGPVVCCVDTSAEAHDAVRVARGLAAALGLELVLLHVEPPPMQPGVSAAPLGRQRLAESEREDADALLERIVRETGFAYDALARRVEVGEAAERILAVCEDERAEMVLGSRGRGSLKAALLGSVSRDVAGKAHCIVVLVPPGAAEQTTLSD